MIQDRTISFLSSCDLCAFLPAIFVEIETEDLYIFESEESIIVCVRRSQYFVNVEFCDLINQQRTSVNHVPERFSLQSHLNPCC